MTAGGRRHHHKVKTGCGTCKARRVKCDERKPVCKRCAISNRVCIYEPLKTWLFVPSVEESDTGADRYGTVTALPKFVPLANGKSAELRALSFFQERTSPSLSAFSTFTKQMWNEIIPRVSAVEDAVRSMTVALATRQELLGCPPERLFELSRVRSTAVSSSVRSLTQPNCDLVAVLLCGLLFLGYECLQDPMEINPDTSVRHLGAGLRILEEHHSRSPSSWKLTQSATEIIDNYIEPMYLQMEIMLSMSNTPIHTICALSSRDAQATPPKLPLRFTNLSGARQWFFRIYRWHYFYRAEGNKPWTPTSPAFRMVRGRLIEWYALIMAYNDTLGNSGADDVLRQKVNTMVSHWSLVMVGMVHSTAISSRGELDGSPYLPDGGRLKTSVVDLTDPEVVTITFIVDAHSLELLEICDWSERGLVGDPALRIWPIAEVRRLGDGSGRGIVKLRMGG